MDTLLLSEYTCLVIGEGYMYSALEVANFIVKYSNDKNMPISNLKLQKLMYFVQAEFLVETGKPCFSEEIEAWDFGPVVPVVYRKYRVYGSANIPYFSMSLFSIISSTDRERIIEMIKQCARYSASKLVEITHNQTPWIESYSPYHNNIIPKDKIRAFFAE